MSDTYREPARQTLEWERSDLFGGGTVYRIKAGGFKIRVERERTGDWMSWMGEFSLKKRWATPAQAMAEAPEAWARILREGAEALEAQ